MKALGIILAGGNSEMLGDLTVSRARAAMPVGACYRAIDFPLSNMSNSGISKIAVITQYNSRSLHDHLNSAHWWNLGRKHGGLFIFTPYLSTSNSAWFRGTADSIYQNISFLKKSNEQYVVIASGDAIYKMDYAELISYHESKEADITIVSKKMENKDLRLYGLMQLDETDRVQDFEEKPLEPFSDTVSLGIYVMQRTLLIRLLETIIPEGRYDFVKDVIGRYRRTLKIYAYDYKGYWSNINSVKSYFDANMDFLKREVRNELILSYPYIKTKPKDEPPVKYNYSAYVTNSLVGSGGILNGIVENSVLFRRVWTGEHSVIKNSIIMEGCYVGTNCYIENAILDKEVVLSDGKQIIGNPDAPVIIRKGTVV